jgi:hypothetical protein
MVRMSDLVRGTTLDVRGAVPRPAEPRPRPAGAPTADERPATPPAATPPAAMPVAAGGTAAGAAEPLFEELRLLLTRVRGLVKSPGPFPWAEAQAVIARAIASLESSADLFWVAGRATLPANADYVAFHQAQVAVLSLRVGANLGYERARLVALGLGAALIDVGLWRLAEGAGRRADAALEQQPHYESHPRLSAELLRDWAVPFPALVETVLQHHEREQGQGFPQRLQGPAITQDAKIAGLVDTYTALTAPPPGRPRLKPHEAIRDLVRSKHEWFAPSVIKALLSEISVFPPGTRVRLNSGEVGRVIGINRNHPLRPRVEVVSDSRGQVLATPRVVDLAETPFLYITGPVDT